MLNKFSFLVSRICHSPGMPVCGTDDINEVDFNFCNPDVRTSEIRRMFVSMPNSDEFEDWSDPMEWRDRLSQTSTARNAIRTITCIGDKPIPASTKKAISNNRKKITKKTHTLLITIDEVTATNHAFIKSLKAGKKLRVWYEIMGKFMFGGNGGIMATVSGDMVLARGSGEIQAYELQVVWDKLQTEDRIESPIYDGVPPLPTPDGTFEIILKPVMALAHTGIPDPPTSGFYEYTLNDTVDFIHVNPIASGDYPSAPNDVFYETEERFIFGNPPGTTARFGIGPFLQSDMTVRYRIPWVIFRGYMMIWSDIGATNRTITFSDTLGNSAYFSPLIVLDSNTQAVKEFLTTDIAVEIVETLTDTVKIRLTRTNAEVSLADFVVHTNTWLYDAVGGYADPLDPFNNDKTILELAIGTYTFGNKTAYINGATTYPSSASSMVVSIS